MALCGVGLAAWLGLPSHATATELQVRARTLGEGYTLRAADDSLVTRRRVVQYLDLGVYELLPARRSWEPRRDAETDGQLHLVGSMRLRGSFGNFAAEGTPEVARLVDLNDGRQVDLLFAYLEGRKLGGRVDLRVGRQFEFSGLDWYGFDGAWTRVHTPARFAVEAFAGLMLDSRLALGYSSFELDGTRDTPVDRLLSPVAGAAVASSGVSWLDARLAYRRTFTPAQRDPVDLDGDGAPGAQGGRDQELVSATAALRLLKGHLSPYAAGRMDLIRLRPDNIAAGIEVSFANMHTIRVGYLRVLPLFDADSIFNVFSVNPFEDARLSYQIRLGEKWSLHTRGQLRVARASTTRLGIDPPKSAAVGLGGGVGATRWSSKSHLRFEISGLDGVGGSRMGAMVDGRRWFLNHRLALDGRAWGFAHQGDGLRKDALWAATLQAGVHARLFKPITVDVVVDETVTPFLGPSLRAFAVLGLDFRFRGGRL